jgi:Flp pilus assembly protein CpaB
VLVNADQAGRLTLADQASELRLALRNPIDQQIIEAEDLRVRDVLADSRSSKRVVRTEDGGDRSTAPASSASPEEVPVSKGETATDGQRAALKD